jgi:hypothetical protein
MKLQHLSALTFLAMSLASLACSAPDDEIFMGGDDESAGSGGSGAGTQDPGGSGTGSGGKSQGGSGSGGSSNDGGTASGGTASGGTASGGTASGGTGGSASGGTGPAPWDPCAGKACGDLCSPCSPEDANCFAPAVEMTCSATGQCSIGRPACTVPKCEGTQQYYAPGCNSAARPIGPGTFTAGCYDTCTAEKCADGFTCTVVWYDPSANCPAGEACIAACGAQTSICIAN